MENVRCRFDLITNDSEYSGIQHFENVFFGTKAYTGGFLPAVLDKDKGGNAGDSELIGEVNIFVNIYFPYFDVIPFFCHGINSGGEHAAGAAPGSPEIQKNGFF